MTLNGVMAATLCYFTEFGKPAFQHTNIKHYDRSMSCDEERRSVAEFMRESIIFFSTCTMSS